MPAAHALKLSLTYGSAVARREWRFRRHGGFFGAARFVHRSRNRKLRHTGRRDRVRDLRHDGQGRAADLLCGDPHRKTRESWTRGARSTVLRTLLTLKVALLAAAAALAIRYGPFSNGDSGLALTTGLTLVSAMAIRNAAHRIHLGSAPPSRPSCSTTTQMMIDVADLLRHPEADKKDAARSRLIRATASALRRLHWVVPRQRSASRRQVIATASSCRRFSGSGRCSSRSPHSSRIREVHAQTRR